MPDSPSSDTSSQGDRRKQFLDWVRTVRDPAKLATEGNRRIIIANQKAEAEYEIAAAYLDSLNQSRKREQNHPSANELGVGKLADGSNDRAIFEYFTSPATDDRYCQEVDRDTIRFTSLEPQKRVYFRDPQSLDLAGRAGSSSSERRSKVLRPVSEFPATVATTGGNRMRGRIGLKINLVLKDTA